VVVLLHGNGGGRTNCLPQAELAAAEGFGSLLVTLRAHSDSTGATNDFGYGARHDVAAAVAWLEARQPGRPILIWGQSLGAAAALFAAPDLGGRVAGYLLECPYRDLRTAVRNRTRYYLPPILDAAAYAGLVTVAPMVLPDLDRIAPIAAAGAIPPTVPVLILAGGADRRALPEEARDLAARIGPNARLRLFPSGDHAQLLEADPAGYRAEVVGFLQGRVATALAPFQDRR
jgi:alpha-beta hydrolase superfamily lysophospholipase